MPSIPAAGLSVRAILLGGALMLACVAPVAADPKPLTKEEQAKVDEAIDKGVAFLKKVQTKEGDFGWKMRDDARWHAVGQCALPAYALLESGVPTDDPAIRKAAAYLRPRAVLTDDTYDLSLAILFFDRLGDPEDKKLIQACALRLIAGQHLTGGWAYHCPSLTDKNVQDLLDGLRKLSKQMKERQSTRDQALLHLEIPPTLQSLTVFQKSKDLPWQEPARTVGSYTDTVRTVTLAGRTDNSNTQFALMGLWAAQRHDVPAESALGISVERFERFQIYPGGFWLYEFDKELSSISRGSMTCAGLIGLAIGRALKLPTPGSPSGIDKDVHVLRGLTALSRRVGNPSSEMKKRMELEDLYFLWSLERVAMLYNLPTLGDKDWYHWGAEVLVTNQTKQGWWAAPTTAKRAYQKMVYGATLSTSFALLFLKRSHPMKDLTPKLPFTAKELNEGIARLRPSDKFPVRTTTTSSESRNPESHTRKRDP